MAEKVRKTLYYRKAVFDGIETNATLQSLLEGILNSSSGVESRKQLLSSEDKTFRAINQHDKQRGVLFCQIIQVNPDAYQPVMLYGNGTPQEYQIDAISPSELDKDKFKGQSDFIKSMLYFGVKDDEVIIMPSSSLTIAKLEQYLRWLFYEKEVIPKETTFILKKCFTPDVEELIKTHQVKSVQIASPIGGISTPNAGSSTEDLIVRDEVVVNSNSIGEKILQVFLNEKAGLNRLRSCLTDLSNIRAKVVISYSRSSDPAGRNLLNALGNSLRHIDCDDLVLKLKNYGELKGDQLNLCKNISVERSSRGLIMTADLYGCMADWLIELHVAKD